MKKDKQLIIIIFFIFLGILNVRAQEISVTISGYEGKAALFSLVGEKTILLDSIKTVAGKIKIQTKNYNFHYGFYRAALNERLWIDYIYDGNDVEIKTDIKSVAESLVVINSDGNKLFHQFIKLNKDYKTKTELLQLLLSRYPANDDFYITTQNKLIQLQNEYLEFVNQTSQSEPESFTAKYIKSAQLPVLSLEIAPENQINYLQSHSLDNVDFNDASLIYSDLFSNKTIEYLMYYRNPQLPKELLEKEFMKSVDTLLNKAKVDRLVYQHLTEYLIDGFKKFGFENIIDYMVENYVIKDDLCLDVKTENSIQRRIDLSKKLAVGKTAPNIKMPDADGNIINMNDLIVDNTLLIFYASWCPHCQTMLPAIKDLYNNQAEKKVEIIAVSIDEKREEWLTFINENNLNWINISDGLGWDGKAALDYSIYATPTMFLLDNDKKIIGKPMSVETLKAVFQ